MSDTPETDDFVEHLNGNTIPFDTCFRQVGIFARKLERERDQWRECAERLAESIGNCTCHCSGCCPVEGALAEFERLKEASK